MINAEKTLHSENKLTEAMENPPRKFHCWIPYQWTFEHPWKQDQQVYPVPSDLKTFTFTHIAHTTHTEEKEGIVRKKGIKAKEEVIKAEPNYSFLMLGSEPEPLTEDKVFPGYYVFSAPIIPELDSKQKKACQALIKRFGWGVGGTEFSDYIEHHSRYGKWMFPMTISKALKLYRYSIEQETKKTVEDIKFKLMGTNRYQWYVGYTVAVTACLEGETDPLEEYPDWDQSKGVTFEPTSVVCIKQLRCFTRDYIEIAFHFPSQESIFHLKSPSLDLSQPQEVFHHVCARSRMRRTSCNEAEPSDKWEENQRERFRTEENSCTPTCS